MAFSIGKRALFGLAGLLSMLGTVNADDKFLYPSAEAMTFYQGDSVVVKYVTDYASPQLHIFCYNDGGDGVVDKLQTAVTSGTGSATVVLDMSGVTGCWFNIQTQGNIWGFNTPIWTFAESRPQSASTTTSPSPAQSTTTNPPAAQTTSQGGDTTAVSGQTSTITNGNTPTAAAITVTASGQGVMSGAEASTATDAGNGTLGSATNTKTPANPTDPANTGSSSSFSDGNGSSSSGGGGTDNNNENLSIAAKAGIGAGVGVSASLAIAAFIFFILARRAKGAYPSRQKAAELPASEDGLSSGTIGPGPFTPQPQQQQMVHQDAVMDKGGWGTTPVLHQQEYYNAESTQYYNNGGNGPYELYSGPHGPELPSNEKPLEAPSPSTPAHGGQQAGRW